MRIEGGTEGAGEDRVLVASPLDGGAPEGQAAQRLRRKRDRADAGSRLRATHVQDEASGVVGAEVAPRQRERLTDPQTRRGEQVGEVRMFRRHLGEQGARLVGSEALGARSALAGDDDADAAAGLRVMRPSS